MSGSSDPVGGAQVPPAGAVPPQVIVVLTDQQRWDTAGVHGNPAGVTPEFDRIAREGTLFEQAVTSNPVCAPARSALQTGRFPTAAGVFRNGLPLPQDVPTLAGEFARAGYATGYIGKWHLAGEDGPDGPVPPGRRGGYEKWLASDRLEFTSDAYRTVVYDEEGEPVRLPGYRSDALFDAAIRFVADHHDRPYLLFLSLLEPHHQNPTDDYPAPAGYRERYEGTWLPPDLAALAPGAPQGAPTGTWPGTSARSSGSTRGWAGCATRCGASGPRRTRCSRGQRITGPTSVPATASTSARRTRRPSVCRSRSPAPASPAAGSYGSRSARLT